MLNSRREEIAQRKKLKMLAFSEILTGLSHQGGEALDTEGRDSRGGCEVSVVSRVGQVSSTPRH